jgi:pyridoxamine 5'-phosphate oxidase family protein
MGPFGEAELRYLGGRRPGWLATVGEDGYPRSAPVAFRFDPEVGAIDIGGLAGCELLGDVRRTGVAALVVDDAMAPEGPRAVEVSGDAVTLEVGERLLGGQVGDQIIRLTPRRVVSWGLEPEAPAAGRRLLPRRLVAFFADVRLWIVLLTGLLAWLVAFWLTTRVFHTWETDRYAVTLTAWACAGGVYVLLTLWRFLPVTPEELRRRLERSGTREVLTGPVMALWTTVILAAATGFTIVGLWSNQSGGYVLVAAFAAVVVSWFAIHLLYAEYYASRYYRAADAGTFEFPDDHGQKGAHGYLDFAYFSLAVASTFGTTDVRILGHAVRRAVLVHEVVSFWFNVVIIAAVVALATS